MEGSSQSPPQDENNNDSPPKKVSPNNSMEEHFPGNVEKTLKNKFVKNLETVDDSEESQSETIASEEKDELKNTEEKEENDKIENMNSKSKSDLAAAATSLHKKTRRKSLPLSSISSITRQKSSEGPKSAKIEDSVSERRKSLYDAYVKSRKGSTSGVYRDTSASSSRNSINNIKKRLSMKEKESAADAKDIMELNAMLKNSELEGLMEEYDNEIGTVMQKLSEYKDLVVSSEYQPGCKSYTLSHERIINR